MGDATLELDGKPLTGLTTQKADFALCAKPDETRTVTVIQGGVAKTAKLVMPAGKVIRPVGWRWLLRAVAAGSCGD